MKKWLVALLIIVCIVVGWALWQKLSERKPVTPPTREVRTVREVTLYFGSRDASHLVPEFRTIEFEGGVAAGLRKVIEELISGPQGESVPTLPSATRLLAVYLSKNTAYLDFSREIVDDFGGGTAAEYMLVASVVQTVCSNFPQVDAVRILVEGKEVDTLGGHLLISKPLKPADWR